MKRWHVNERNGDATLIFYEETEEKAFIRAKELLINISNWIIEEGDKDYEI